VSITTACADAGATAKSVAAATIIKAIFFISTPFGILLNKLALTNSAGANTFHGLNRPSHNCDKHN
jgi:hypothetical protein